MIEIIKMVKIKRGIYVFTLVMIIIILTVSMVSAGVLKDIYAKITGKASTQTVGLNITVTAGAAPVILEVYNYSMTDISSGTNEGPSLTFISIVFNASDAQGVGNLNNASAKINVTLNGGTSAVRENTSCALVAGQSDATSANFTCNITMAWWDAPGTWDITAYIADLNSNICCNASVRNFAIGPTDGMAANQSFLNWSAISPGASNQEASDFVGINNTGNRDRSLLVNSSDLIGETNADYALGANNFSVKDSAGCEGTAMVNRTDTNVTSARLLAGNYTANNATAKENLYFCLETSNLDLTAQAYSTSTLGTWILKLG
jgi:hypothetical protein